MWFFCFFVISFTAFTGQLDDTLAQSRGTWVSGRLIYPSEFMPGQKVCAVSVSDEREVCTYTRPDETKFRLFLPTGDYFFYAQVEENRAWFTSFDLECGYPCRNNTVHAILVEVDGRAGLNGICPCDWYTNDDDIIFRKN